MSENDVSEQARARTAETLAADLKTLHSLGYAQELLRRMSGFSNFAISFSMICILAGGITSFQLGLCSVGGAALGLGWPLGCLFSLGFALAMGQVASAFPTAGGLYHWASILGGRGWGWLTAWFNLAGLLTVLAAINVGAYLFTASALGPLFGLELGRLDPAHAVLFQLGGVVLITLSQALFNHLGIKLTTRLTDFSGYLIFAVSVALTASLLVYAPSFEPRRLITFVNYSGLKGGLVWPHVQSLGWLFLLGLLLPSYTVTGFDASAHISEETIGAAENVPRSMVRAVLYSGLFGWVMLCAIVLAIPDLDQAAAQGANAFFFIIERVLPSKLRYALYVGISLAQYLCGLATVTSTSRMAYAFARDGGLPFSGALKRVSQRYRTPAIAIWTVAILSILFTVYTPVYSTITAVCTIFLYISYLLPIALGFYAWRRTWTQFGPWTIGGFYRPVAALCVLGCAGIIFIGVQPPNDKALGIILGALALTAVVWFAFERKHFRGPPQGLLVKQRQAQLDAAQSDSQSVG